ncbi:YadA C-terminal domain-containing protein [Kluyvera intermedia]|uniref:YadA C-terminal domain-containing protein n=1 Tax=Kluyvera intermedia TaxID=61648 RepID=UPI0007868EC3|nr:YadA C-terminal domain-containing protein [Kluyvera intermedia]WQD31223.1 YadA C-terminal domain-containing protein [Kluyvera intermedia]
MKSVKTTLVFGIVFFGSMSIGNTATIDAKDVQLSSGWDVETVFNQTFAQIRDLDTSRADQSSEIYHLQMGNLLRDDAIQQAEKKGTTALLGVAQNGSDIIKLQQDQDTQNQVISGVDKEAKLAGALADTADKKADANSQLIGGNTKNINENRKALSSKVENTTFKTDQDRQDADITNVQTQAKDNSGKLANHESRITRLESQNNARFSSVERQQNEDRKEYRAGIAGVGAIAGLHYVDTDNAVAVGAANFKDAQGYAMGYRHKFSENIAATMSASGTSNGDEVMAASASIGW